MNTPDSLSMNSSRPYDPSKNDKIISQSELLQKKDEELKLLQEKYVKLEKDSLKFQIQLRTLEEKLKSKIDKEYVINTNTSSNFIMPSEFRKMWEDFTNKNLSDCFIDFYENPILAFHLIQEVLVLSSEIFKDQLNQLIIKIMEFLNIKNDKISYKLVERNLKVIIQEYHNEIFECEKNAEIFESNLKSKYKKFAYNELENFDKENEFEDLITSRSFKQMICIVKKILLYIEFHDPPLTLKLDVHGKRKIETKVFKQSECICVEGLIKESSNCLILLQPPILKNGFVYQGLKPVVMIYKEENRNEEVNKLIINNKMIDKFNSNNDFELDKNTNFNNSTLDTKTLSPILEQIVYLGTINSINADSPDAIEKNLNLTNFSTSQKNLFIKNLASNEAMLNTSDIFNQSNIIKFKDISPIKHCSTKQDNEKIIGINSTVQDQEIDENIISKIDLKNSKENIHPDSDRMENDKIQNELKNILLINFKKVSTISNNEDSNESNSQNFLKLRAQSTLKENLYIENLNNFHNQGDNIDRKNMPLINLNGLINTNNSFLKDQINISLDKVENMIHSSRSNLDSITGDNINFAHLDELNNEGGNEYEFENTPIGTENNYNFNKNMTTSLSNSFKLNKKKDLINGLYLDKDNICNLSGSNFKIVHSKNITQNSQNMLKKLINFSDKKSKNSNLLLYQTSERELDINALSNTLEKLGSKKNKIIIKASNNQRIMKSNTKSPKIDVSIPHVYSPRNNVQYIFNNKQVPPNTVVIKVARKKNMQNPTRYINLKEIRSNEEKNSKNSSLSREQPSIHTINSAYQSNKTIEDEKYNNLLNCITQNNFNLNLFKNKEIVKNKVNNLSNNNFISNSKQAKLIEKCNGINIYQQNTNNSNLANQKINKKSSYQASNEEYNSYKKTIIQNENKNQQVIKKTNKSIDRKVLTNAQTRLSLNELLSLKKNDIKNKGNPQLSNKDKHQENNEIKYSKSNFLNIKYV